MSKRDFIDSRVIARLKALPLYSRSPMLGSVSGMHRSPHRGSSLEFAEYRKYVPGDDTRRLDWRAFGRSDRFYIKEFEADTNLRMCLVVDTSGSMGYAKEGGESKLQYARRIAGTLAYLALGQGDAVGLYCANNGASREVPPRRSGSHLRVVLDRLEDARPEGETGLAAALHAIAEKVRQRAMVVVISDLFEEPAELGRAFQHLRFRKHDCVVFHLLEPQEVDFDFQQPMRFVDLEGGIPVLADPSIVADEYRKAIKQYLTDVDRVMRDAIVDYRRVNMASDYADVVARFLLSRAPKKK